MPRSSHRSPGTTFHASRRRSRRSTHHGLCQCTPCATEKKTKAHWPIVVVPFAVASEAHRNEPTAVLSYGGVQIHLSLTYVHYLRGLFCSDHGSSYWESNLISEAGLHEIERRMWKDSGH